MRVSRNESRFRYDIQGLRAVAVLLVAFGHGHLLHLTGGYIGVDVFFVISGYLITQWLLRERSRCGAVAFRRFYAARARRILPAAALTLVATDIACVVVFNPIRALSALHDSIWAAFFAANIHFAQIGTNYFANTAPPSPFQHFWSLAVEEQFYLIWPAVLMVVVYGLRRVSSKPGLARRLSFRLPKGGRTQRLAVTLAALVLASFVWSVIDTSHNPVAAYFSTFTREWELGVGALLVVSEQQIERLPMVLRSSATWVGLIAILTAAFLFNANTAIPGFAAAVPVLGAAFIIAGGVGGGPLSAGIILGRQPFVFVGDVSYTFYLWHWPALIVAQEYVGHPLPAMSNLLLLILAFAVSVVTFLFYENPIRRGAKLHRWRWAFLWLWAASLMSVLVVASVAGSALTSELVAQELPTITPGRSLTSTPAIVSAAGSSPETQATTASTSTTIVPADPYVAAVAASTAPSTLASSVPGGLSPPYQDLANDIPNLGGCGANVGTSSPICHFGDTTSRTLVAFGNSHVTQWLSPLKSYATSRHWDLVPLVKPACYPSDATSNATDCSQWYSWVLGQVARLKPAAILLIQEFGPGMQAGGVEEEIAALKGLSPKIVVFEDTPTLYSDPTDCLLSANVQLGSCLGKDSSALTNSKLQADSTSLGFDFLPTLQWFCYTSICPVVIAHTIAYMTLGHISNTYASELTTPLAQELDHFLG